MIHRVRMRSWVLLASLLCLGMGHRSVVDAVPSVKVSAAQNPRQVLSLNRDWLFTKGDVAQAADPTLDDSNWQQVHVPHDWAIAGPFNPQENGYAGKLPWKGLGWYRKRFTLTAEDAGRRVYIDFDGVMAFPKVYINGKLAGTWDYGYMAFRIDATDYVRFGQENLIAVQVDTRQHGTRWYPGAGIYRKVTMTLNHPVHIAHWGSFVTTPQVSDASATIRIKTTLDNHLEEEAECGLEVMIQDPEGATLAVVDTPRFHIPAGPGPCEMSSTVVIPNPQRWDLDKPRLYRVVTTLRHRGKVIDVDTVSFGIRSFKFTADDGFHLNGRRVQLYGVNLHHDHGPLGAAFYTRAMERQLEIMKDMGCNAIRTSHNPSAAELLDLCDRMGILVWDEAFDKWDDKAGRVRGEPPLEAYGEKQIRNLVLRDRNHPSVVVWSIGNEIGNQPYDREGKSPERVKFMSDFVRKYDPTRPVGIGCHIPGTADEPILDALDLTGWNYARRYARYRENYPDKPIIYSESASALSTRGFYNPVLPNEKTEYAPDNQVCSYDLNAAAWSDIPDAEFRLMQTDHFVAGEFVWTGFDYLGEPTPFTQAARSSYFGIVDLCGIPKDRFYLYRSHWRPDATTVHILPHWNWPDRIGKPVPVFVYTNGDSAELFVNGRSLGRRSKGVLPKRPQNHALNKPVTVSSAQAEYGHRAVLAVDGDSQTRWCAADGKTGAWWQVDLQAVQPIRFLAIEMEKEVKLYGYTVDVSRTGDAWETVVTKPTSRTPRWGGPRRVFHELSARARYLRITFTDMRQNTWASIREVGVYPEKAESDYYDPTYTYRLRWNQVIYEPGELKVVAYKDGLRIGETTVCTAGVPALLRLTPDRRNLQATGEDLCYVLVEALDSQGNLCPLADNPVRFQVTGPAEIAGVGNGNPLSLEPFQAHTRKLFYGKAMLILRTQPGQQGQVGVTATSAGLSQADTQVYVHD